MTDRWLITIQTPELERPDLHRLMASLVFALGWLRGLTIRLERVEEAPHD